MKENLPNYGSEPFTVCFEKIAGVLDGAGSEVFAVGHRVVHGGEKFGGAVVIDDKVRADIKALCPLAPIHNPANLLGFVFVRFSDFF